MLFQHTAPELRFQLGLDDLLLADICSDGGEHSIKYVSADIVQPMVHRLSLSLSGKTPNHTEIDDSGQIVWDCAVIVKSIKFNDIDITYLVCEGAKCYHHDNNGATGLIVDEFFGYMGQNGQVLIEFETPLHAWFLKLCQ